MISTDSRGNNYVQVTPFFRVTVISTDTGDEYRFNIVTESGRVLRGPQIPLESIAGLLGAMEELAEDRVVL